MKVQVWPLASCALLMLGGWQAVDCQTVPASSVPSSYTPPTYSPTYPAHIAATPVTKVNQSPPSHTSPVPVPPSTPAPTLTPKPALTPTITPYHEQKLPTGPTLAPEPIMPHLPPDPTPVVVHQHGPAVPATGAVTAAPCAACDAGSCSDCADCQAKRGLLGHLRKPTRVHAGVSWERLKAWLCYRPERCPGSCILETTPYQPPLYSFFPCISCGKVAYDVVQTAHRTQDRSKGDCAKNDCTTGAGCSKGGCGPTTTQLTSDGTEILGPPTPLPSATPTTIVPYTDNRTSPGTGPAAPATPAGPTAPATPYNACDCPKQPQGRSILRPILDGSAVQRLLPVPSPAVSPIVLPVPPPPCPGCTPLHPNLRSDATSAPAHTQPTTPPTFATTKPASSGWHWSKLFGSDALASINAAHTVNKPKAHTLTAAPPAAMPSVTATTALSHCSTRNISEMPGIAGSRVLPAGGYVKPTDYSPVAPRPGRHDYLK